MTITAVVPTCDRPQLLKEAIISILNQTLVPDEIIVVNNGKLPVDLPVEFVSNIKVFNIDLYSGAACARNYGAEKASGSFVAFLDDDDLWGKKYLENVVKELLKGSVCVVSRIDRMDEGFIGDYKNPEGKMKVENFLIHNPGFGGTNLVIAKEVFFEVGGFPTDLPTAEDKSLAIELLRKGIVIKTLPENQTIARIHDQGRLSDPRVIIKGTRLFMQKYGNLMSNKQYLYNWFKIFSYKCEAGDRIWFLPYFLLFYLFRFYKYFSKFRRLFKKLPTIIKKKLPRAMVKFLVKQKILFVGTFSNFFFNDVTIFFRDDDVDKKSKKLVQLIDLFIKHLIPINLAVIPATVTRETVEYLLDTKSKFPDLINIHQHGFQHINYGNDKEYEFGEKRSYEQQYQDISRGKDLMNTYFGDSWDKIFTPPHHGFDQNTLRVLNELDFKYISFGTKSFVDQNCSLKTLPVNVDFIDWHSAAMLKSGRLVENEIKLVAKKNKLIGVVLHHEYFKEADFKVIENVLVKLKSNKKITFCKMI